MAATDHTIVADFLTALKVPFTKDYTRQRFETMPFKTLFGVTQLLKEYGVETAGYNIPDKAGLADIPVPFIAGTKGGMVIVTNVSKENIRYLTQGLQETMPVDDFQAAWTGMALCAQVAPDAKEPEYGKHLRMEFINSSKKVVLLVLALCLVAYLYVTNGLWKYWSVWALTAIDLFGLWITYMLVQKSLSIKNAVADKVCGVIQEGGCDKILKTDASSFFGIFSWSEVGFTYFGVSLLAMLISPQTIHWLALINICCLPYTVWSVSYQKFEAKHWCTLCLCVQLSLWLQFVCYLFGGWTSPVFPLDLGFFALGATFIFVLLGLNRILPHFSNNKQN